MTIPKFRAWDVHEKKMFTNAQLIVWNGNVYANDNSELNVDNLKGWSIDEKYLMQSTDFFDKNEKEIFEDDIVKVTDTGVFGGTFIGRIIFLSTFGLYGFNMLDAKVLETKKFHKKSIGFLMRDFGICFTLAESNLKKEQYTVEIIGNVWENPELLEDAEQY